MNTTQEQKTYVPKTSAKLIRFQSGKEVLKLNGHAETLAEFIRAHANERGYITLGISALKPENQDDRRTHSVWLDTWKPGDRHQAGQAPRPESKPAQTYKAPDDDVPY